MNLRTLSVIALSNRDFASLEEKLLEAVAWLELAAGQGAELVVLPECLNRFCGDGAGNPMLQTPDRYAFDDWRRETAPLVEAAERLKLWVTIPVVHRQAEGIFNSFFLVSPDGEPVWRYDKLSPTPSEMDAGVVPGKPSFYDWRGIQLGGAICFDSCFPENLDRWADEKVQLAIVASLWPGGSQLNTFCKLHASRVAVAYPAWSRMIDIDGLEVAEGGYRQETLRFGFGAPVYTATLNFDRLSLFGNHNQEMIVAILRKYGRRVRVTFDQGNCLWFLESCDPDLEEREIQREFGLVTATDYFADCARQIREGKAMRVGRQKTLLSRGFTLVELLVTLGIVLVLAALIFSGMKSVRASSERAKCAGHLRSLGTAIHTYAAEHQGKLPVGNRVGVGNIERLLSAYTEPMKTATMAADVFYCPGNVRLNSPPAGGYPGGAEGLGYKGWSGYFLGYLFNASLFPITVSDPHSPGYTPDNEAQVRLASIQIPAKTVALMDLPTRAPGVGAPPCSGLARNYYFNPESPSFILGTVHNGSGNILFVDGHVEAFTDAAPLPINSLPGRTTTWWP